MLWWADSTFIKALAHSHVQKSIFLTLKLSEVTRQGQTNLLSFRWWYHAICFFFFFIFTIYPYLYTIKVCFISQPWIINQSIISFWTGFPSSYPPENTIKRRGRWTVLVFNVMLRLFFMSKSSACIDSMTPRMSEANSTVSQHSFDMTLTSFIYQWQWVLFSSSVLSLPFLAVDFMVNQTINFRVINQSFEFYRWKQQDLIREKETEWNH